MWVERPAGTHLSQSQTPGGYSSLARDDVTNGLETHATLFPIVDDDESESGPISDPPPAFPYLTEEYAPDSEAEELSEAKRLLAALIILGTVKAAEKIGPHARSWWDVHALPAIKKTRNRLAETRRTDSRPATRIESTPADSSQKVIAALEKYRVSISSTEARERFFAALISRLFSEEQMRVLRNARIEDEEAGPFALISTMEGLTPRQLEDCVKLMLETHPTLLDEHSMAELGNILDDKSSRWRVRSIDKRKD